MYAAAPTRPATERLKRCQRHDHDAHDQRRRPWGARRRSRDWAPRPRPAERSRTGQQHQLGNNRDPRGRLVSQARDQHEIGGNVKDDAQGEGHGQHPLTAAGNQDVLRQTIHEAQWQIPDQDLQCDDRLRHKPGAREGQDDRLSEQGGAHGDRKRQGQQHSKRKRRAVQDGPRARAPAVRAPGKSARITVLGTI